MKRTLFFIFTIFTTLQTTSSHGMETLKKIKNNILTKGYVTHALKATLTTAALANQWLLSNAACDAYEQQKNYSSMRYEEDPNTILFGKKQQNYLRNRVRSMYSLDKPLYFGIEDSKTHGSAHNYPDANYAFLQYDLLPHPAPTIEDEDETESVQDFLKRTRKKMSDFYEQVDTKDFEEHVEKQMVTFSHEIGHLEFNHTPKTLQNNVILQTTTAAAALGLNAYLLNSIFLKNASKTSILKKLGLSSALLPASSFFKFYSTQAISRKHEREADAFAYKHSSIEQLKEAKKQLQELHTGELNQIKRFKEDGYSPLKIGLFNLIINYFNTHPSVTERIAMIEKAIKEKKE